MKYPKDKNGREYKVGDLFEEGVVGEKIWGDQGEIIRPPVGIFVGERVEEKRSNGSGWYIRTYQLGVVKYEGKEWDIYVTTWDGEFVGDWDDTMIVGNEELKDVQVKNEKDWEEVVKPFDFPEIKGEMEISEVGMEMLKKIKWSSGN